MNERKWLERYARALEREQAREREEQERAEAEGLGAGAADGNGGAEAGCSTIELINREGTRRGRGRMDARAARGWQIAEVERLLGLSRRDIQRACYDGQGGAGIVHPKESSWGRRSYDVGDLERLFHMGCLRDEGLSLPEVRRAFDAAEEGAGGWEGYVTDRLARMREEEERDAELLARAEALEAATSGPDAAARLDEVIEGIWLGGLASLRAEARSAGDEALVGQADAALAWFAADPGRLAALWAALEDPQDGSGGEKDAPIEAIEADAAAAVPAEVAGVLPRLLDAPGMELALELRLGPGGHARALRLLCGRS